MTDGQTDIQTEWPLPVAYSIIVRCMLKTKMMCSKYVTISYVLFIIHYFIHQPSDL